MIVINKQKRTRIFALQEFQENSLRETPTDQGLPDGLVRLLTAANEMTIDQFKSVCVHPDFARCMSQGHIVVVGASELFNKIPMESAKSSVKPLKRVRKQGVGIVFEEQAAKEISVKVPSAVFLTALAKAPKKLSEIKNLSAYEEEQDAMLLAEYAVDLDCLKKWLRYETAQKADDRRHGVIETLEMTIKKVEAFDKRLVKARAGDREDEE